MSDFKTEVVVFAVGTGLMAAGLSPVPAREGFLIAGTSLASFAYSHLLLAWRKRPPTGPSLPSEPAVVAPTTHVASETTAPPPAPSSPRSTRPTAQATQAPAPPAYERPAVQKRKLPSVRQPQIAAPKWVVEHRVPISLILLGFPLLIAGLILAGLSPPVALGYGLLIPGILLLALQSLIKALQRERQRFT